MNLKDRNFHQSLNRDADLFFKGVPVTAEAKHCQMWEYARQSSFIRNLDSHWMDPVIQQLSITRRERLEPFLKKSRYRFPDASWQMLSAQQRSRIGAQFLKVTCISSSPTSLKPIVEEHEASKPAKRTGFLFLALSPDVWEDFSRNAIVDYIGTEISDQWKKHASDRPGKGKTFSSAKTGLTWLGLMRIRALHPPGGASAIALDSFPDSSWDGPIEKCVKKWDEIRQSAKYRMAELFPFLDTSEVAKSFPWFGEFQ